jgi:hypothetical protein
LKIFTSTPASAWIVWGRMIYAATMHTVKASADCQSWAQARLSRVSFSIRKATAWNPDTGQYEGGSTRSADVYVFCHYSERDKARANVLDIAGWDFYLAPVQLHNRELPDKVVVTCDGAPNSDAVQDRRDAPNGECCMSHSLAQGNLHRVVCNTPTLRPA